MLARCRLEVALVAAVAICRAGAEDAEGWESLERDGRVEACLDGEALLAWQLEPLASPVGGAKFAASAFLHPLRTPAGFEWTCIQPADHRHHFGVWWPWKFVEVDGERANCWEIQAGEGAQLARGTRVVEEGPGRLVHEFRNETVVKRGGEARVVIHETARVSVERRGDACVLDFHIVQKPAGAPVTIPRHRYSGFTWRGPLAWNKDTSTMITSEGRDRDDANGTAARWVVVSGAAPSGAVSVLLMTAAEEPEKLRVWNSATHEGMPFVNFNPVQDRAKPLDAGHPSVSDRSYRIIAADHAIDAAGAERAWKRWTGG